MIIRTQPVLEVSVLVHDLLYTTCRVQHRSLHIQSTMAPDFQLDVGDYARGYDNLPDGIDNGRFTDDPNWRKFWVVKLEFKTDPSIQPILMLPCLSWLLSSRLNLGL